MMKKILLSVMLAGMMICGVSASDDTGVNWGEKIALYIPNRIVDAFDCFSVNVGVGPTICANLMATRFINVGGSWGDVTYTLYKDYNRQYGGGIQQGWYWQLICIGEENMTRERVFGWVRNYWEAGAGVPRPDDRVYLPRDGARDYWQFGGSLGFLISGEVALHPIEGFDFLLGFFFLDFKNDDLTFADFQ
ncbi:MAG: hypothetical protein IKZ31_03620 [Lentisphaeria bacterium]|nr:hypothetical protein [Lentisphaeria bacterium]